MKKMDEATLNRLIEEQSQLQERIDKCDSFIKKCRKNEVQSIDIESIHLLEEQLHYMNGYNKILKIRLYQQGIK